MKSTKVPNINKFQSAFTIKLDQAALLDLILSDDKPKNELAS